MDEDEEEEEEEDEEAVTEVEQGEAKLIDLGDDDNKKDDKKPTLTKQAPLAQPDDLWELKWEFLRMHTSPVRLNGSTWPVQTNLKFKWRF